MAFFRENGERIWNADWGHPWGKFADGADTIFVAYFMPMGFVWAA
jgi:hypothetical protein